MAAALLLACGPREVPIELRLVTGACAGPDPFAQVSHLVFRTSGEGIAEPLEEVFLASRRVARVTVPAGRQRQVEILAWAGAPHAPGRLVSRGVTPPFEVPQVLTSPPQPLQFTVFLRAIDAVTPPSAAEDPQTCTLPLQPRAGHTATPLPDGRVFIAGGYAFDAAGLPIANATSELFDPATGTFAPGPLLDLPRAFHTASSLPDGRVFIAGGETYDSAGVAVPHPTAVVISLAEPSGAQTVPLVAARSRHAAAMDGEGRVLLLGGRGEAGALAGALEWWSAESGRAVEADQSFFRAGAAAIALPNGMIAAAGGEIGSGPTELVQFFEFSAQLGTFTAALFPTLLEQPRRSAAIAPFGDGEVLVVGGFSNSDDVDPVPLATSERIAVTDVPAMGDGPNLTPRGELCAVEVGPGRVLAIGGRGLDEGFFPLSMATVELILKTSEGTGAVLGLPPLPSPRMHHSCTRLPDGSVLVVGGVTEQPSGERAVQGDAAIISPHP